MDSEIRELREAEGAADPHPPSNTHGDRDVTIPGTER